MPRGASPRREREYENLKAQFEQEGRYRGREEEVAARIVNKQRAELGETRRAQQKDREGRSPDRLLPVPDYEHLTLSQIGSKLGGLSHKELRHLRDFELSHRDRKGVLDLIRREMSGGEPPRRRSGGARAQGAKRSSAAGTRRAPRRQAARTVSAQGGERSAGGKARGRAKGKRTGTKRAR